MTGCPDVRPNEFGLRWWHQDVNPNVRISDSFAGKRKSLAVACDDGFQSSLAWTAWRPNREFEILFGIRIFQIDRNRVWRNGPAIWRREMDVAFHRTIGREHADSDFLFVRIRKNQNRIDKIREDRRRDHDVIADFACDWFDGLVFGIQRVSDFVASDFDGDFCREMRRICRPSN